MDELWDESRCFIKGNVGDGNGEINFNGISRVNNSTWINLWRDNGIPAKCQVKHDPLLSAIRRADEKNLMYCVYELLFPFGLRRNVERVIGSKGKYVFNESSEQDDGLLSSLTPEAASGRSCWMNVVLNLRWFSGG